MLRYLGPAPRVQGTWLRFGRARDTDGMGGDTHDDPGASVRAPIFGLADDDPLPIVFKSRAAAESYAEPWDVEDGLWSFWDRTGQKLAAEAVEGRGSRTELAPTGLYDTDRLRSALTDGLAFTGVDVHELNDADLEHLAGVAADRLGGRRALWRARAWLQQLPRGSVEAVALVITVASLALAWSVDSLTTQGLIAVIGGLHVLAIAAIERNLKS